MCKLALQAQLGAAEARETALARKQTIMQGLLRAQVMVDINPTLTTTVMMMMTTMTVMVLTGAAGSAGGSRG